MKTAPASTNSNLLVSVCFNSKIPCPGISTLSLLPSFVKVNFIGIFTTNVVDLSILPTSPIVATQCGQ